MGYDCKYMDVNYITSSHNRYIYIYIYHVILYLSMLYCYTTRISPVYLQTHARLDPMHSQRHANRQGDVRWCAPTGVLAPLFFFSTWMWVKMEDH